MRIGSYSLSAAERTEVRLGLVLLQVLAQSGGSMEGGAARVAEILGLA